MLFGIGWWAELGVNKDANTHLQETIKEAFNYTFCTLLTLSFLWQFYQFQSTS
jgi:hypothetical protein